MAYLTVAVIVGETAEPIELAAIWDVFGNARVHDTFEYAGKIELVSEHPGKPVEFIGSSTLTPELELGRAVMADLVWVAEPANDRAPVSERLTATFHEVLRSGGRIVGMGRSVLSLAESGLLDGRQATTSARLQERLGAEHPAIEVMGDVAFVDANRVITGTGAAAIDAVASYVLNREFGFPIRNERAGWSPSGVQRPAGGGLGRQVQPATSELSDEIAELQNWAREHLNESLTVEVLASRAFVSTRSLTRRFRAETGTTPYAWVLEQRLLLALELLEAPRASSVKDIARESGFHSAAALRQHFQRAMGYSPSEHRRRHRA